MSHADGAFKEYHRTFPLSCINKYSFYNEASTSASFPRDSLFTTLATKSRKPNNMVPAPDN